MADAFGGMSVVLNPLAREVRTEHRVERNAIRKRRRNWRVVVHHIDRPGCYVIGGHTLVVHPDLKAALMAQASKEHPHE